MGNALRYLRYAVLAWGTVSLLGLTALFGVVWLGGLNYPEDGYEMSAAELEAEERRQVEERLKEAGLGDHAIAAIEQHTPNDRWGGLQVQRVRLAAGVRSRGTGAGWYSGGRLPTYVALAIDCARPRGPDWMPSLSGVASGNFTVHAGNVTFGQQGLRDIDLVLLQPATGTGWLVRGNHLDPTAATDRIYCGGKA